MDETESKLTWNDLTFPCLILIHELDVEGVTQNPPIQVKALNSTLNRDFIFTIQLGWIKSSQYELIEEIIPPVNPPQETDSCQGGTSKK